MLFLKGLILSSGLLLLLFAPVEEGAVVPVPVTPLTVPDMRPVVTLFLGLAWVGVPTGAGGAMVVPLESRQAAAPVASR